MKTCVIKQTKLLKQSILFCMRISWQASRLYTITRLIIEIFLPFIPTILASLNKSILNTISGATVTENPIFFLSRLVALVLFFTVVQSLLNNWEKYIFQQHTELIQNRITVDQLNHVLAMDLAFFDKPDCYDNLISSVSDSYAIADEIWTLMSFASALTAFGITFSILINWSILYTVIIIVVGLPSSIITTLFTKKHYQMSLEQIKEGRRLSLLQNISFNKMYAQDIRLFHAGPEILRRFKFIWKSMFLDKQEIQKKYSFFISFSNLFPLITIVIIGFYLATEVIYQQMTIGDYTFYVSVLQQLWGGLVGLSSSILVLYGNRLKFENLQTFMEWRNTIVDGPQVLEAPIESIEFSHVSFRYTDEDPLILNDISFKVITPETLAIVGVNGSGKSTLIKLLLRMYEPTNGVILINGEDIKIFSIESLRSQFSVYFQGMLNFPTSLRENFTIGDRRICDKLAQNDFTDTERQELDERILLALKACNTSDILARAILGLDHPVSRLFDATGLELSAGQNQKLAIARALFRDHSSLILDEPTASLDAETEFTIWQMIRQKKEEKLIILVTQKLTNLQMADKIILIERGRILESGSYKELLMNNGKFSELYCYQQNNVGSS